MTDTFEFNDIDNNLSKDKIITFKHFYKHYHKKFWCSQKSYKKYKLLDETINIFSLCLVIIGTITGGVTLNPVISWCSKWSWCFNLKNRKNENDKKKVEMAKIAYTTYEKVLVELTSALRGDEFNKDELIDQMKVIDEMIIDQTPLSDIYAKKKQ